jgi:hypothetical protein
MYCADLVAAHPGPYATYVRARRVAGLAVLLVSTGGVAACASIAGLESFSKTSCNGGDCDAGDDGVTGEASSSGDGDMEAAQGIDATGDGPRDSSSTSSGSGSGSGSGSNSGGDSSTGSSGGDASHDSSSSSGGIDSGCGPLDTITNCGACGASCDTTESTGATCTGTTCNYTGCATGHSDCNKTAPDTNGCECATPACCGTGCQTVHSNGVGQSFYDCNPVGTITLTSAIEACMAYALTVGGNANDCVGGWYCYMQASPTAVCYSSTANMNNCTSYCWVYTGSVSGGVQGCTQACNQSIAPWN